MSCLTTTRIPQNPRKRITPKSRRILQARPPAGRLSVWNWLLRADGDNHGVEPISHPAQCDRDGLRKKPVRQRERCQCLLAVA